MADEEFEDKYERFFRYTDIDLIAEIAAGGTGGGLTNYYTKTESDAITNALDERVTTLEDAPPSGGVTDHGQLTGLLDDDHPQYLTNSRGDDRYYTKTQSDANFAAISHTHNASAITAGTVSIDRLPTGTSNLQVALGNHIHDDRYYTESETDTLLSGKQASDSDLTAIAGLSPTNNDVLQRKSGAWINRTPAQLKTDLSLTQSDVGLANVNNTSDANKPVSTATQTALDAKAPLANTPRYLMFNTTWPARPADSRMTFYIGGDSATNAPTDSVAGDVWIPST